MGQRTGPTCTWGRRPSGYRGFDGYPGRRRIIFFGNGRSHELRVYWAPNEPGAIAKAVRQATQDRCDMQHFLGSGRRHWKSWTTSDVDYVDDMEDAASEAVKAGMTVFAASGDNDSSDGGSNPANVDVPSSCPSVVGSGETTKTRTSRRSDDDPGQWNGEEQGAIFGLFPPPMWQSRAPQIGQVPARRMVPAWPPNARTHPGYNIFVHARTAITVEPVCRATLCGPFCCSRAKACAACCTNRWAHSVFSPTSRPAETASIKRDRPDPCTALECRLH